MKYLNILVFIALLLTSCGKQEGPKEDEYLEEEEHLEQKDHDDLADHDTIPDPE